MQGLGRFDAIFHPAVIDLHQSKIKPPFIQPDFIPQVDSEGDVLPAYMHYVAGISPDEATEAIRMFVERVSQRIDSGEPYEIEKFGIFSKSDAGVLHFTPDWDAFNLSFSGLKVIDLHPVHEVIVADHFPEPPIRTTESIQPISEITEEHIDEHIPGPIEEDEVTTIENEEIIPPVPYELPESTSRLAWIILTTSLVLITILCAYLAWDIISDRQRMNQLTQTSTDTLTITNEFDIPVVMDTTSQVQKDTTSKIPPLEKPDTIKQPVIPAETETPCFVVVGAFSNQDNVSRMVQRLESLGYKSSEIKGGSLTRVAINTSCDKDNLEKVLNEARSAINPEAWIY